MRGRADGGGNADKRTKGYVPFWVHQLVELLLALLLMIEGARSEQHTAVLVAFGAAVLLLAFASDGPLGAWPWIGRRLHRVLDFVLAAALAVAPFVLALDRLVAVVVLEAAALGMLWLALRTRPAQPRPSRSSSQPRTQPRSAAHRLGEVSGRAWARWRDRPDG